MKILLCCPPFSPQIVEATVVVPATVKVSVHPSSGCWLGGSERNEIQTEKKQKHFWDNVAHDYTNDLPNLANRFQERFHNFISNRPDLQDTGGRCANARRGRLPVRVAQRYRSATTCDGICFETSILFQFSEYNSKNGIPADKKPLWNLFTQHLHFFKWFKFNEKI